ncbi:hypothetical protein ACHQM5_009223 [Ranunculus cassubicifolius]
MALNSISRIYHLPKPPTFSLLSLHHYTTTTSENASNYWKILQSKSFFQSNLEKTLTKIRGKLDSSIVEQTLHKLFSTENSVLGLRFFIWAGIQPDYRHSNYMYSKACKLYGISRRNRGIFGDILRVYKEEGCVVSVKTFKVILNLCREGKMAEEGLKVLRKMGEFDCRPDTTVFNVVIGLFCERGEMVVAEGLMKEMGLIEVYPDMSTYIAVIKGFCNVGRLEDACRMIRVMRDHGCVPNVVVFSTLLHGFCRVGDFDKALEFLSQMEKEESGWTPNVVTYTSVIQCFCENGRTDDALLVLDRMEARGCFPNRVTVATLSKHLCSEGRIEEAYKLVDRVVAYGSVLKNECYSSLVVSLLRIKNLDEAEKLFRWMLGNQIKPDGLACSILVKRLCSEGKLLDGFQYYVEIEKANCSVSIDSDIYSILLEGLCQQGHLVEAARLIDLMIERKIKLKTPFAGTLVRVLENSGQKELALHLRSVQANVE